MSCAFEFILGEKVREYLSDRQKKYCLVFGLQVAWVLVRYRFPGRRICDAFVDLPMVSEIVSLLIVVKLERYDYVGATAVAVAMLGISFALLLTINLLQAWSRRAESVR